MWLYYRDGPNKEWINSSFILSSPKFLVSDNMILTNIYNTVQITKNHKL